MKRVLITAPLDDHLVTVGVVSAGLVDLLAALFDTSTQSGFLLACLNVRCSCSRRVSDVEFPSNDLELVGTQSVWWLLGLVALV
jgi:hypothetical protein